MAIDRATRRLQVLCQGGLLAWLALFGAGHTWQVARVDVPGEVSADVREELRWLTHALDAADPTLSAAAFPEGALFLDSFYGLALENVAETTGLAEDREAAVRAVRRLLPRLDALLGQLPFSRMARWKLRGGICWFAGQNLLRGRLLALEASPDPAEVTRFQADSRTLFEAFEASESGVLEAHPGLSWPVDSVFGLQSLQVHDRLYGTRYARVAQKWLRTVQQGEDRATGLMPSFVHADGSVGDLPRGCALSWSLASMPDFAPAYAQHQWVRYKRQFMACAGGLCLFREYPRGRGRAWDADSGPIVEGYGMAATAFALAAARAEGDAETAESLRRTGELLGLPALTLWGKRYLGGSVTIFDVFAVWTRTVPYRAPAAAKVAWGWALGLGAAYAGLVWLAWRALLRARAQVPTGSAQPANQARLGLAVGLLALHLAWPGFWGLGVGVGWWLLGGFRRIQA
jgi:hypothetical protein